MHGIRFYFWALGLILALCVIGARPVQALSTGSQNLVAFNSYELMDQELNPEFFSKNLEPHDFDVSSKTSPSHRRFWAISLIRSTAQSFFLTSGRAQFNGSNYNIPPTLKAYQTP